MDIVVVLSLLTMVFPFLGFLIIGLFAKKAKDWAPKVGTILMGLSLVCAIVVLILISTGSKSEPTSFTWLKYSSGGKDFVLDFGFRIDFIAAVMLVVVTLVSFLVHMFSMDYMHGDPGIARFYAELQLFTMSMLGVVTAINLLQLFMFWELVGLCSYLLIGFWFAKRSAYQAAKKAFFVTKVGDTGLFLGIIIVFFTTGTLNLANLPAIWASVAPLTLVGILVFMGAVGKSAQFPLHVWLPNAMEGPTPVSALIHAATMVAAGVYMVSRTLFLFTQDALLIVMCVGGFTAFFAATIATVQEDIKKVLAYSTISQLGYMVLGLGSVMIGGAEGGHATEAAATTVLVSGGCIAAFFHLMTHAFFKGLLFLGSGSVIHATHTQNMHEMGGLYKKMKTTGLTFILGSLALAGIFPFAGFWSKDMILANAYHVAQVNWIGWIPFTMAMCAAFLTPYYMTRCVWLTFFGKPRKENHAHEGSWRTTTPLIILAVLAVLVGLAGSPFLHDWFQNSVAGAVIPGHEFHEEINWMVLWASTGLALLGIFVGSAIYIWNWVKRETLIRAFRPIYIFLKNRWFIDELWTFIAIKPMFFFAKVFLWIDVHVIDGVVNGAAWLAGKWGELCFWFDQHIVDGMVNGFGWLGVQLGELARLFDKYVIDGFIDGMAASFGWLSGKTRKAQTGYVQNYAAVMFASLAVIMIVIVVMFYVLRR